MENMESQSPSSSGSNSVDLTPSIGSTPTTPPTASPAYAAFITVQVHNILFHQEEDPAIKWQFLTTKAPFPVTKVVQNKAIVELLLTTEPGPKVDYGRLRANLTQLRPLVSSTPSGPDLLSFFGSLFIRRAHWLNAAARLEAFRSYDRTLFTYYVEWYGVFQKDTAGRGLDDGELTYEKESKEHAAARMAGFYARQEDQLMKDLEAKTMELVTFKTSREMWKYSRIFWTITEQYQLHRRKTEAVVLQKRHQVEEMKKRKTEEILRKREEAKRKNEEEEVQKRQMGIQLQQDANNLFMQQDWDLDYAPAP